MCLPCLYVTFLKKATIYPENELPASTTAGKPSLCYSLGNMSLRGAIFLFCSLQRTHARNSQSSLFLLHIEVSCWIEADVCYYKGWIDETLTSKTSHCRDSGGLKVRSLSFPFCSCYLFFFFCICRVYLFIFAFARTCGCNSIKFFCCCFCSLLHVGDV